MPPGTIRAHNFLMRADGALPTWPNKSAAKSPRLTR